ncbi:Elongation of very long chain fatty acids like protein [Argiope bruennichi]|uniref:Elongation of very long chain fatty acids protein n=1 Tax=Argiope bruennichi TaxID=94029 RepID=A0A8T0FEX8_ARGBR|nr:Elongation of very long chain fatty acids like protein [Argiope bruennichi]
MFDPFYMMLGPSDPRMVKYPLMSSVMPTVFFSTIFLLFVKVIGPAWMKNREPYNLRHFMVVYNIFLVGLSGWITSNYMRYGWLTTYSWRCEPIDVSNNPAALKAVQVCWVFYISKLVEYLDTIIFVLRKKYSQINFLHVFHHSTVPVTAWLGVSYGPGGYNTFLPMLNSFVHVWMYLYYGLSAVGPEVQKYLWWKKYLTSLQLVQFTLAILYFVYLFLFAPKSCNVSPFLIWLTLGQAIVYFGLFSHFYLKSYKQPSRISKYKSAKPLQKKEQ